MILLVIFAFLAGIVTILSPCILPILPIILSSSLGDVSSGKNRPLGVIFGFILSFTFFTLFLSTVVRLSGVSAENLRFISIFTIGLFGVSILVPKFQPFMEKLFSKLSGKIPKYGNKKGFFGGVLIGLSIGLLWTPCVGPILASVISLAITGTVTLDAVFITFSYAIGTAIPMFVIMVGGQKTLQKIPKLTSNLDKVQKVFGVIMIITAIGIYFNIDRKFQTFIINTFPNYGTGLTKFEDNDLIKNQLDKNKKDDKQKKPMKEDSKILLPKDVLAPEIIPGGAWFNSDDLTLDKLKGKVVLIDFWTYSCINCQRTLPYLRNWYEKYGEDDFVIIGVHSPEFEFEKNKDNLQNAINDFELKYPIVQDNNFDTWRAYNNRYWPAKYLIDKDGFVRYYHFGEGNYDETEKAIQELLEENSNKKINSDIKNQEYEIYSKTQELYLGYSRIEYLKTDSKLIKNEVSEYTAPKVLNSGEFNFLGNWKIAEEYANPQKNAKLNLNFEAKKVFLVMRKKNKENAKVKVYLDGKMQYFGKDNKDGIVTVEKDTLYELINLDSSGKHYLKLEFLDGNAELYAFTFG